jgi:hypothetical protein
MQFLAPTNIFEGVVQLNQAPTADNHAVTKSYLEANAVVGIATDSANYAELVTVNGEKQLKLKPLTITDVSVDTTATSLSGWVTANYTNGDEKQEGDIIVLTAVSGRAQTFIHNGGTAGDSTDFAEIEGADVTDAEIRSSLSASAGIDFNSSTGEFTADQGEIRGFFSAGSGLSYDGANGVYSLNVDSDGISEGSTNLYHTVQRVRNSISVSGDGIAYDASTGVIDLAVDTDDITEQAGAINQFFTNTRARGALSVGIAGGQDVQLLTYDSAGGELSVLLSDVFGQFSAGQGLSWDGGGTFSLDANTDDITELAGATNKFYADSLVDAHLSGGTGISYTAGVIALDANTDDITEEPGATNKFFTDSRARLAISADPATGNMASYDNTTGEILVALADFRSTFAPQNLTANTWATLNHQLGEKIVHVSAYDSSGNKVQLDVQLVDSNNVKVKSVINVTGAEIVVSL